MNWPRIKRLLRPLRLKEPPPHSQSYCTAATKELVCSQKQLLTAIIHISVTQMLRRASPVKKTRAYDWIKHWHKDCFCTSFPYTLFDGDGSSNIDVTVIMAIAGFLSLLCVSCSVYYL